MCVQERRENYEKKQAQLLCEAQAELAEYIKMAKVDDAKKADLEARVQLLKDFDKHYEDPGLLFDCVVYFDGKDWRAVIDVEESGDVRGTNYKKRKLVLY